MDSVVHIFVQMGNRNPSPNMQRSYSSHGCFLELGKMQRVDLVWDVYIKDSLTL